MTTTLLGDKVDTITSAVCYIEEVICFCPKCGHTQEEALVIYKNGARENICLECKEAVKTRRKNGRDEETEY